MPVKIAWLFVTYLLYSSVFYTMIIIPYGSMASAMSNDALDRTKLSNWRHIGGTLAVTVTGCLVSAVVFAIAFVLHTTNVYVWIVIYGGVTVGLALFNPVTFALVTDIVDDEEVRTGKRMDGTIYSVYSFGRKFGSALSSGVTGMVLSVIGYTEANMYEPAITNGIYNISCIVPMIGFALMALIVGVLYPLNKKRVDANVAILKQKHGEL